MEDSLAQYDVHHDGVGYYHLEVTNGTKTRAITLKGSRAFFAVYASWAIAAAVVLLPLFQTIPLEVILRVVLAFMIFFMLSFMLKFVIAWVISWWAK